MRYVPGITKDASKRGIFGWGYETKEIDPRKHHSGKVSSRAPRTYALFIDVSKTRIGARVLWKRRDGQEQHQLVRVTVAQSQLPISRGHS